VVVVDGSIEGTVTRAASFTLQLQLVLLSARTHVLHAKACSGYRTVARLVNADAIVFIGNPPATAVRGGLLASPHIASYRAEGESLLAHLDVLPSLPRLAADRLIATAEQSRAIIRAKSNT
jgi:hypothetical protein